MTDRRQPPGGDTAGGRASPVQREIAAAFDHHRRGRLEEADRAYRGILERHPEQPDTLNLLGVAAAQRGQPEKAVDYLQRAIRVDRGNAMFHYNLGMAHQGAGDLAAAETSYRRAIERKSDYADALKSLGGVLLVAGRLEEAEICCRKVVRMASRDASAHYNLSSVLLARRAVDEAAESAREALRLAPDHAGAHNNLGTAHLTTENFDEAETSFREALRLQPKFAEAHNNLGMSLLGLGKTEEALAGFREAIRIRPDYVQAHSNLGNCYRELGYVAEAAEEYRTALSGAPDFKDARAGLAATMVDTGDFDGALDEYETILRHHPAAADALESKASILEMKGDAEACHELIGPLIDGGRATPAIASLFSKISRRFDRRDEARTLLEDMLARDGLGQDQRRLLHFALGALHDNDEAVDEAFRHFAEGNALKPTAFDPEAFARRVARTIEVFDREHLAREPVAGNVSELPVFIVGMPRSGTSLTEQILASHSRVHGAGELRDIGNIITTLAGGPGADEGGLHFVADLDRNRLDAIAEAHLGRLRELAGDAARVTDKMPYNFLRLGLIARLFPKARVIHCVREPLDTCLSCYFQNFRRGNPQTYRLEHLGAFYAQYERLMAHWHEVLELPILDLRYEDLVADLEGESRRLVDFVGLDWDPQCLRFHESKRVVNTASYDQVRQPIYTRSVARWRAYDTYLDPLKAALAGSC